MLPDSKLAPTESFKLALGVNKCSNKNYHSDKSFLSSSTLKLLNEDPAKFYDQVILGNAVNESKPAYDLGSYVHTLCLEPDQEHAEYAMFKGWRKAGKDWEAFKDDPVNKNKTLLSLPQVEQGRMLAKTLKTRPEALELLSGGEAEVSICSHILGVPVKKRSDYINWDKGYIADIKTSSAPGGVENFREIVKKYSYDLSAALYTQIAYQHYGKIFDFYLIVISKLDKKCDVYKLSSATLSEGSSMVTKALVTYKKCTESGIWVLPDNQPPVNVVSEYKIELI